MKNILRTGLLVCGMLLSHLCAASQPSAGGSAGSAAEPFNFGVIAHPRSPRHEESLREAIAETDSEQLAFVVVSGIKAQAESCNDNLYHARKELFDSARNGLIVSLAGSDWTECKGKNGRSTAIARLNRLREVFFSNEMSLGGEKIPLLRQSTAPKFRGYGENARWEVGNAMFATVNLPENNNHYLTEAGRNSEFEDRLIANRDWLNRVFTYAKLRKVKGVVLFCDGNPLVRPNLSGSSGIRRDGFAEVRQQIAQLAARFPGKVLLVLDSGAGRRPAGGIVWRNNVGSIVAGRSWTRLRVDPAKANLFALAPLPGESKTAGTAGEEAPR